MLYNDPDVLWGDSRISLGHSTLGRQQDWKWQELIKKFSSWQTGELANWILQHMRHQGGRPVSRISSLSIPHLVAQWDGIGAEGRRRNKESAGPSSGKAESMVGAPSRVPKASSPHGGEDQPCFWHRAVRTITNLIGYLWCTLEITERPPRLQARR